MRLSALRILLLGAALAAGSAAASAGPDDIQVDFEKIAIRRGRTDTVSGTIYYRRSGPLIVRVLRPCDQWIRLSGAELSLYYPGDQRAFLFIRGQRAVLPIVELFMSAVDPDFGLTALGYVLTGHVRKGDTLVTFWAPGSSRHAGPMKLSLTVSDRRLIETVWEEKPGRVISRSLFSGHVEHGRIFFPMKVATDCIADGDSLREEIEYRDPRFDLGLPGPVLDFRIPEDAPTDTLRW